MTHVQTPPAATPVSWRVMIFAAIAVLFAAAYLNHATLGTRGQAAVGIVCFIAFVAGCSANLRAVNLRTLFFGMALQFFLAIAVTQSPQVQSVLSWVGKGVTSVLDFSGKGGEFVFGNIANPGDQAGVFGDKMKFPFAFVVLPPIIFVSALFSLLYYFGVLQFIVKVLSRIMMFLMRTSGAETLSVSANVFMGQTEAPLIVKPFVPRMTQSELLAMMASGMAHVSGGMMAVYIGYMSSGKSEAEAAASATAILATVVMACPCSLYLSKLLLPETEVPETLGTATIVVEKKHVNPIDAIAAGTTDGLKLALNVAAMLIAFIALVALMNSLLGSLKPVLIWTGISETALAWWPDNLTLEHILGWVFRPLAFLIGVQPDQCDKVGSLLGIKLVLNEHVAFVTMTKSPDYADLTMRSRTLAAYALTGFANFASVGIQLGGIGAMAENRRADLARLGMRALFVGFVSTLLNAAVAGLLL